MTATSDHMPDWCQACGGLIGPRGGDAGCSCGADHTSALPDEDLLDVLAEPA